MKAITTKTYPGLCVTRNGNGKLADSNSTTDPYRTCPVCNGLGQIMIVEETKVDDEVPDRSALSTDNSDYSHWET